MKRIILLIFIFLYNIPLHPTQPQPNSGYVLGVATGLGVAATVACAYFYKQLDKLYKAEIKKTTIQDVHIPALKDCEWLTEKLEREHRTLRNPKVTRQAHLRNLVACAARVPNLDIDTEINDMQQHDLPSFRCSWDDYFKTDCESTDRLSWRSNRLDDNGERQPCTRLMRNVAQLKEKIKARHAQLTKALESQNAKIKQVCITESTDPIKITKHKKTVALIGTVGFGALTFASIARWFWKS